MPAIRPMGDDDVEAAVDLFNRAFDEMRPRFGLPPAVPGGTPRQVRRSRHLLAHDPGGAFVAVDGDRVVGMAQSLVRGNYWVLSLLAVDPDTKGRGLGRALLAEADAYGRRAGCDRGTIQCSRDPGAMALYQSAGYDLHPAVAGAGPVRRRPARPGAVAEVPVSAARLGAVAEIDRERRGADRSPDLAFLLAEADHFLLWHEGGGYAVVKDDRVVALGARHEATATELLQAALARSPEGVVFEVGWLTANQAWAVRAVVAAGLEIWPTGPVMVRGMDGPPSPYLPSGGLG